MTDAFPFPSSVLFRRVLATGAFVCVLLLTTIHGPAHTQTNPQPDPPDYNSAELCTTLGGTLLPVGDANVCQNLDASGTFCIVGSQDAFPCEGLYKRVDFCHNLDRPALNPFICGPVCANGQPLGGTCQLPFADAILQNAGQIFTFTRNNAARTGTYHGERRGLHFVYFSENNIIREDPNKLATFADHAAQCALGNAEGKTAPWRTPTLAETAVLIAETSRDLAVVSETDPETQLQTQFQLPLPPDICSGQCAQPLQNRRAAAGNAILADGVVRPEILAQAPSFAPQNPVLIRAPHQTRDAAIVFPCVAPVASGYQAPPPDFRIQITPNPQNIYPAYSAPGEADILANTPLFIVSAVARRWTTDANNNPVHSIHQTPITLRLNVGESEQILAGNGRIVRPVSAAARIDARQTVFISVAVAAQPQIGPAQSIAFQYAHLPVQPPPPVIVIADASVAHAAIPVPPQMEGDPQPPDLVITGGTRRPGGVSHEINIANRLLTRRGPPPTGIENVLAQFTHPAMRGILAMTFVFRPVQIDSEGVDFIPAADLKRGGFRVFHTENIPLFTLTSSIPGTRLQYMHPLHGDPLNYLGFAHRFADNHGEQLEFSAVPLSVATQLSVAAPAVFYVARSPTGSNVGWYPAYPAEGNFGAVRVFTYARTSFSVVGVNTNPQCSKVPGATRLLPDPSDPTNLDVKDVYECAPVSLCRSWGGHTNCRDQAIPARVVFGDFIPRKIPKGEATRVDLDTNPEGQRADQIGLHPDPDFAPSSSEAVLIDLHPIHRARCVPSASNGVTILQCPPPVRAATVVVAALNDGYKTRAITTQVQTIAANGQATLVPHTVRAAALLTLEITVSVRTEGINFNPDEWFPPDNTADLLRNPEDRQKQRYHPARVVPDFASQITAENSGEKTETVIRHPVMIVPIPPNIRHNIAIPPDSGFAITIVPRDRTPVQKTTQTGDPAEGEGVAHPHYPAEIRYAQAQNQPDPATERLAIFYVPPNRPIPAQTSRQAVVRFTVIRLDENSAETPLGAGQLTLSLTAVAKMPVYDSGTTEINERFNYWNRVSVQDVVPPEILGMQNVLPELINDNLLKDGTMTYLGAYRPKLRPGHVPNPHAFTIVAQDEPAAFGLRLNSTLTSNLGLVPLSQIENHTPVFAGDHILSVKYSNPNVFLGEYLMTFRAQIPPASESNTAHWDAGWSVEEGVRRMLAFTPEQLGEVVLDQSGTLLKNYRNTKSSILDNDNPPLTGLEEALLYQGLTAEWLTRVQAELNAYVANPEMTVFLDGEVPPNNYPAALARAVEWIYERINYDNFGSYIPPPYVPFSLAQLGYYSAPVADVAARRRSIATFLYRHQPSNRIMQAPRIGEGYSGDLPLTYDPVLSFQRQSADVRARIPPDAPNRFELPNGLAGMFVRIPSGLMLDAAFRDSQGLFTVTTITPASGGVFRVVGARPGLLTVTAEAATGEGYLEVVETGDGRLSFGVPIPMGRFARGTPPPLPAPAPQTIRLTSNSDDELTPPVQPTGVTAVTNVFVPRPPPSGSGDGEFVVHRGADILKRKPPPNYAPETVGTRALLTAPITIQEVRSYVTVDAVLYVDLTVENGTDLTPLEMPLSAARAGESFAVRLPESERRRFPGGGEWRSGFESSLYALSLRADDRVVLTHDLTLAGLYLLPLEYHPRGEDDLLGGVRYRFGLRALKTEGDAAAELANAAAAGNRDEVSRLLRESPVPGTAKAASGPYAGKTPLHAALMGFSSSDHPALTEARINIVWELVENGANHWTTDDEGLAPMHRAMHSAAHNGTTLPIRALATAPFPSGDWYEARTVTAYKNSRSRQTEIDDKVTITARYALGPESAVMANGLTTALEYAAVQQDVALVNDQFALSGGWGEALLEFARFYGAGGTGCNPDLGASFGGCLRREYRGRRDASTGETPLHVAVRMRQTMTVEALLAGGWDVNAGLVSAVDIGGSPSPMHYAVSLADADMVELLAEGFVKGKTSGECPLGIVPTVVGEGETVCRVRTNYQPGGSWILNTVSYPSIAITPPIYATILLSEALSASPQDASRIGELRKIDEMLSPPLILPITATIPPASLVAFALEVHDWLLVAAATKSEPVKTGALIVRDALLNYLNGEDNYFGPIGRFQAEISSDDNISFINAISGAFVNGGTDPNGVCSSNNSDHGIEFFECGFSPIPRLRGVVVQGPVVVPQTPIINRVVGANFFTETYTVYWRPPLYDGGSRITAYQMTRTQVNINSFSHPTACDDLTDAEYTIRLNPWVLAVGPDFSYASAQNARGFHHAGVANGNCYRWHLRAMNEAGMSSEVVTDPILSRGFSSTEGWTDWDTTSNAPNTPRAPCAAGASRPYAYNANNWGTTCYPNDRLDRADKCNSLRAEPNIGGATRFEPSTNECYVDYTASDVEHQAVCTDNGLTFASYAASREHCAVPAQCGTLSEYNIHHRECHCQGWAQPVSSADDGSPSECECKVSGADATCECPSGKAYDAESHSCV